MQVAPQKEHEWLTRMVGEWTCESELVLEPGKPPTKFNGTASVRSLGGLWILCEGQAEMPGGGIGKTLITLGYDPQKSRYVGTFVGSMMTNMWIYEGEVDSTGKVLPLDTEGPSCTVPGKTAKYQDIIEWKDNDYWLLRAQVQGEDGLWHPIMTAHYRRTK